jgi:ParB family chromosome partitioning protein
MKLHTLKILPKYYLAVASGEKTFELRKNDRDYQVGDLIIFTDTDGTPYITPNKERIVFRITYILENVSEYGLDDEYCVLALKRLVIKE